MPRGSKAARNAKRASDIAAVVNTISEEERADYAALPELHVCGAAALVSKRPKHLRTAVLKVKHSMEYVDRNWHRLKLTQEEGDQSKPTVDYGGFNCIMNHYARPEGSTMPAGTLVRGSRACFKSRKSETSLPDNGKEYADIMRAAAVSLVTTRFVAWMMRFAFFCLTAAVTKHTDDNTRGSQPNAMLCLEEGGEMTEDQSVNFRCSLMLYHDRYILPVALGPSKWRFVAWDNAGVASITEEPEADFWLALQKRQLTTIGLLQVCMVELSGGVVRTCPLVDLDDPATHQLPASAAELSPLSLEEALSQAQSHPWVPQPNPIRKVRCEPKKWYVFFGWRYIHWYSGNPAVRRIHAFSCPLRSIPTGQTRRASEPTYLPPDHFEDTATRALTAGQKWQHIPAQEGGLTCCACSQGEQVAGLNELLCCKDCHTTMHMHCLAPPLMQPPVAGWRCSTCSAARKRQRAGQPGSSTQPLSEYELERAKSIKANQAKLVELGL